MAKGRVLIVYDEAVDKGSRWIRFAKGGHFHSNSKGPTFNIKKPYPILGVPTDKNHRSILLNKKGACLCVKG